MPYIKKLITSLSTELKPENKAFCVLMRELKISINEAQKLIDKKRLICNEKIVESKNQILSGAVELVVYEPVARGVQICFENEDFGVLEKPSGVLSHPNGRHCEYSLNDEIITLWGSKACVTHRLDKETSGLIIVAKNKNAQKELKKIFENREISKTYLALVRGKTADKFSVNLPMQLAKNYDDVKMRMQICSEGKVAISEFEQLEYWQDFDASLLKCKPKTGRQHQLRLHLYESNHAILGEPLYGLLKEQIESILDGVLSHNERLKLTGAKRLLLHAYELNFSYKNQDFKIKSKIDFRAEFLNALKPS